MDQKAMNNPLVSIVILNWNGKSLLEECLASVFKLNYSPVEIIVVDNNSMDGSQEYVRREKRVKLLCNDKNLGYAGGNNVGIEASKGNYIAVLNNDIVVDPAWLDDPVRYLEHDDTIGMISCRQMNYAEHSVIDVLYHIPTRSLSFYTFGKGETFSSIPEHSQPGFVLSASGGSAVYRKKMLDEIGGFDERFFAYAEDADLSMRAFLYSWKCLYLPSAVVYHRGSASFSQVPEQIWLHGKRNRYYLLYKYFPLHLIIKALPWIANDERRELYTLCVKQKNPGLGVKIFRETIQGLSLFSAERKKNLTIFNRKSEEFQRFKKYKKLPLAG